MGELRLEHVEAQLAANGMISLRGNKFEPSVWIYKAADEPSTCNAVNIDALSRHPNFTLQIRNVRYGCLALLGFRHGILLKFGFQGGEQTTHYLATVRAEEID